MKFNSFLIAWILATLAGCGGGGGGGGGGGAGVSNPPLVTTPPAPAFPTLVTSATFTLPVLQEPSSRTAVAGQQQGVVLVAPTTPAGAGVLVELLTVADPTSPVVLASARTSASGGFVLLEPSSPVKATDRWIRATLADGTLLRAYAAGWAEVTPGSETAVAELSRLLRAGAFADRPLTAADLASAQQSLTLYWAGDPVSRSPGAAVLATRDAARVDAGWNQLLSNLALLQPEVGAGDVAGLMPANGAMWISAVDNAGKRSIDTFTASCFAETTGTGRVCGIAAPNQTDVSEQFTIRRDAIRLQNLSSPDNVLDQLLAQVGDLALLELPYQVGTRVMANDPQFVLKTATNIHAAVKITRRTYPIEQVQALSASVPAIRVVLDYEIALLDISTNTQTDVLARETRWFSPRGGRVRIETLGLLRAAGQVQSNASSVIANSVTGSFLSGPSLPFAGLTDVVVLGLRHRHAIYAPALGVIYVATPTGTGQILELDPRTLTTLRTLSLTSMPTRLAVSADGRRLYAGLAGGSVIELATQDLSISRRFNLISDPYNVPYDTVTDLAVDPSDASQVLVLASSSGSVPSGAVLLYRAGLLVLRDAPRYFATDYGWGYYSPNALAWTSTPGQFLTAFLGSPYSLYRFGADATGFTDVSSLLRVDDLGWIDWGGEILTGKGAVLDALSFKTLRQLSLLPFPLSSCTRLSTSADACGLQTSAPAGYRLWLEHASGNFLGAYQPARVADADVKTGCPERGITPGASGYEDLQLSPAGAGKVLVSAMLVGQSTRCALQVWSPRGLAAP